MQHREKWIGTVPPEEHIPFPSFDNRTLALLLSLPTMGGRNIHRLMRNGHILFENDGHGIVRVDVSFDGTKVASAHQELHLGTPRYDIRVNGEHVGTIAKIDNLVWLSNARLAWTGWTDRDYSGPLRTFINTEDVTDDVQIDLAVNVRSQLMIGITENDLLYRVVLEDGGHAVAKDTVTPKLDIVESEYMERLRYGDVLGPEFDHIKMRNHMYSFTSDHSRVGYIGTRLTPLVRSVAGWARRRQESDIRAPAHPPWYALPIALLLNPYSGFADALHTASRREVPAVNDRAWKKGYAHVHDHFFTPDGAFVVLTSDGHEKFRVVIDEEEGPEFELIDHVRYLTEERTVSYLARRGKEYLCMTVHVR